MEKAYKILCDKYALVKFCDRIIKQTITMYKNRSEALFLVYRNKPESKTRYWRKLEAQQKFLFNLPEIMGKYEKVSPRDSVWKAFKMNKYPVLYVLVHLIKTVEVCFFFFLYIIYFN